MHLSSQPSSSESTALGNLRRRWGMVALLYAGVWWLGYQLLQWTWYDNLAERWRYFSATMALVLLTILWRGLPHNRRTDASRLWPTLGHANWLSLVRGILLFLLAGFIFLPRPTIALTWLPALLYTADRITDLFDGYLARVTSRESKLGAILDIELDGLGLLVAVILGVQYGLLPSWYLLLAVSRQLFVAGMTVRRRAGLPNRELPPSDNRRVIAGFQTGFLSVMLWPILTPSLTHLAAYLFAIPLIFSFGRDWLVVSHVVDPSSSSYARVRRGIKLIFEQWLPFIARCGVVVYTALLLWQFIVDDRDWQLVQKSWSIPDGMAIRVLLLVVWGVAALLVGLGVGARLGALVVMTLAVLHVGLVGLIWQENGWLFVATVIVAHLGSGWASLWQPEERWLHTQYGKQTD
ncbi:MAG: CDP-alcohol phosphatidyltransferase family protein [Caldilineaceae bacterium]|nr:CDP-alcohol phosphatidyltransferase family protein [Caldilineaceae bacterium]